jgi:hypothetical protein
MRALVVGTSLAAIALVALAAACTLSTDLGGLSGGADAIDGSDAPATIVEAGPLPEASSMQDAPAETGTGNTYADLVLADGPAAYYRLEDAVGSNAAKDELGKLPANVTSAGITFGNDGAVGHAALFNGSSALDLGDVFDFAGQVPFTLELWMKPTGDSQGLLIHKRDEHTGNTPDFVGYVLYLEGPGQPKFEGWGVALSAWTDSPDPPGFVHLVLAVSYVTGKGNATLYINALPSSHGGFDNTADLANTPTHFTIGRTFTGVIDEVAIYAKALPPDRILAHYRAGKP